MNLSRASCSSRVAMHGRPGSLRNRNSSAGAVSCASAVAFSDSLSG